MQVKLLKQVSLSRRKDEGYRDTRKGRSVGTWEDQPLDEDTLATPVDGKGQNIEATIVRATPATRLQKSANGSKRTTDDPKYAKLADAMEQPRRTYRRRTRKSKRRRLRGVARAERGAGKRVAARYCEEIQQMAGRKPRRCAPIGAGEVQEDPLTLST